MIENDKMILFRAKDGTYQFSRNGVRFYCDDYDLIKIKNYVLQVQHPAFSFGHVGVDVTECTDFNLPGMELDEQPKVYYSLRGGTVKLGSAPSGLKGRHLNYFKDFSIDDLDKEPPVGIRKLISARLSKLNPFKKKENTGLSDKMIIFDDLKIHNIGVGIKPYILAWAEKYLPAPDPTLKYKHPLMNSLDPHKGAYIRTNSGLYVDVQFPTPEMFCIEDIAHGLAGEFRFAKQTTDRYTVAQHCIEMSRRAPAKLQLVALLHDAPEFIMGDMAKPIKVLLDEYKRLENGIMKVIAEKYGIDFPFDPEIKRLDTQLLEWEYKNLFTEDRERFFMVMSPWLAKDAFLKRFHELTASK